MFGLAKTPEWEGILKHAAYVRSNPCFDAEARAKTLALAENVRAFLQSTRQREPLDQGLNLLFRSLWSFSVGREFIDLNQETWMRTWASSSDASFRRALLPFMDSTANANARFELFATALEEAEDAGVVARAPLEALWLGSLFNFAVDPESVPVVDASLRNLEQVAGFVPKPASDPLLEQYQSHLLFAQELNRELLDRTVDVRDMLDVQSLIFFSASVFSPNTDEVRWTSDLPAPSLKPAEGDDVMWRSSGDRPYLSVCACLGYDVPYLVEWLEFHRLVGVERFFLYNNGDREAQRKLLQPYVEEGLVVLHDWPVFPPQRAAHQHCLAEHREDSRWIAFIDTDEFLFSPTGRPLPDLLVEYEGWPGVGANWVVFGSSGHHTKPPGLVIESYVMRWRRELQAMRLIKSIVDPRRVIDCQRAHWFVYDHGHAVDENHYPIANTSPMTSFASVSRLRVNHYFTRSHAEFREKLSRPRPDNGSEYQEEHFRAMLGQDETAERDDAILAYVPRLRAAVSKRNHLTDVAAPVPSD